MLKLLRLFVVPGPLASAASYKKGCNLGWNWNCKIIIRNRFWRELETWVQISWNRRGRYNCPKTEPNSEPEHGILEGL